MYTVIVADDEEEIRRSLIRKVDWQSIGFEVVGEAENGVEAMELVEKLEPDLLLTDVRMPFISGIELARRVREIRPTVQIAFLSGFDDFSYAQQAIQYNIISYLLKPISSAELTRELHVIKEKIDQKFQKFAPSDQIQEKMEKAEFLMPLILDGFQIETSEEEERALLQDAVACGVIKAEKPEILKYAVIVTSITDENGKNRTERASVSAVDSLLNKYVKAVSIYVRGRIVSLLMATPMGFEKYLHILVEDIMQSVNRIMELNCSMGVSRIVDHLSRCHECYLEAMNAISYAGKSDSNVYFITDEERMEEFDQERVQKAVGDIENLLRGGSEEELRSYLTEFFADIDAGKISPTAANFILLQVASVVFQVAYAVAGNDAIQELQQHFPLHNMSVLGNGREALHSYVDICLAARELIADQRKKSSAVLCDQATKMINERYMDQDLSLVSVSNEIAVSPNYLSALIKKSTGSTFTDLLTRKRIETAKELLLCTSLKIREISKRCGYNDQHYFSYCFKKYTGVSPNNCRRLNEENKVS